MPPETQVTIKFRKKGVWSQRFDQCICCNSTEKKHFAHGLCCACYNRAYRDAIRMKKGE